MTILDIPLWQFIVACAIVVILAVCFVWFVATPFINAANDQKDVDGWTS